MENKRGVLQLTAVMFPISLLPTNETRTAESQYCFHWCWPTCLSSTLYFLSSCPTSDPSSLSPLVLSRVSLIFCVTILTQHFLSLSSVSAHSCLGALTASFGQCPSLFASPPRFGNPGIAGNHWWIRTMRSLSLFSLPLPLLPSVSSMARGMWVALKQWKLSPIGLI